MNAQLEWLDIYAIAPLLILLVGTLTVLLIESFCDSCAKKIIFPITCTILLIALISSSYAGKSSNPLLTPWLRFDSLTTTFNYFFLLIGLGITLISTPFFKNHSFLSRGEYDFLLLSSITGLMLIGASADFLTLFIGLEILSISLYILCGYLKKWTISHEAALKYFLTGALAAALFLYGIALIYGAIGTTNLKSLLEGYNNIQEQSERLLFLSGIAFITVALSFKAALVPFHSWAPDVYAGAPTPITAFMSIGTKVGAFAALALIFLVFLPNFNALSTQILTFFAYLTMIYANFVALKQTEMRRFFAYSGISNAGFLLIPIIAATPEALSALIFYLMVYALATLVGFSVVAQVESENSKILISDLKGLFYKSPLHAFLMTLSLLTLAGIPPTAGFLAKFYIFKQAFQAEQYGLVVVGLLMTILSVFYYLRIISTMLSEDPEKKGLSQYSLRASMTGLIALTAIIILSIFPILN